MASRTAGLQQLQRRRIIWSAFVVAATVYAAVPYLIVRPSGQPMPIALRSALHFGAAGAAVSSFVARRWWTNSVSAARATGADPDRLAARLTAGCTVTWALAEAVAIIGMMVALLAHDPAAALPLVAIGIATLYFHRPAVWPMEPAA